MYNIIESVHNQMVGRITKLAKDKIYRQSLHCGVIYGLHLVEEAIKSGLLKYIVVDIQSIDKYSNILNQITEIYTVSSKVMDKLNGLNSPIDIMGVVEYIPAVISSTIFEENCLMLENIQDPLNMGSILRIAQASGVTNIIISHNSVDIYNPKVLRSSQGAIFQVKTFTDINLEQFVDKCRTMVLATVPNGGSNLYTVDLTPPTTWIFGNEGNGVSSNLLDKVTHRVTIPMQSEINSLNVGMAVSVCLFEQLRQRLYV